MPEGERLYEDHPQNPINTYGQTKKIIEIFLKDLTHKGLINALILRYFNVAGSSPEGEIGENHSPESHLIPNMCLNFLANTMDSFAIFGQNYPTPDGTGVRDYIHVVDLANAHVKALDYLNNQSTNPLIVNIGTGIGYSVLDMIKAFEKASGKKVPYQIVQRRTGDISTCYSDSSFAKEVLNWESKKTIDDMCIDSWKWQNQNPNGYNKNNKQ
jgi:UDP-glucose 4-epimerase